MSGITYSEYYKGVAVVAVSVAEMLRDEGGDDPYDLIHQVVDSHAWMTYYHYQGDVMEHTDNATALTDDFGESTLEGVTGWYDIRQAFAFWAFVADICAEYWGRFDEYGDPLADEARQEGMVSV